MILTTIGGYKNRAVMLWTACWILLTGPVPVMGQAQIYQYQELYSFHSGTDGYSPQGALVQGAEGNFYGTTYQGGQPTTNCPACGFGTVFRITPEGALTTLAWFHGRAGLTNGEGSTNFGGYPLGSMVQASDGNFHGSSEYGGFMVTPNGVLTSGTGGGDVGDPIQGTNGYIYAADAYYGVVAWASPDDTQYGQVPAPGAPSGGLIQASDGNFYGLTSDGGTYGYGTAYKLTPSGMLTTLVSFGPISNAPVRPYGKLLQASDGNLYGVANTGDGVVFRLTLTGQLTNLARFGVGDAIGLSPNGGLIEANDGNFYGTTAEGGLNCCPVSKGTIFRMTPRGGITTIFEFTGQAGPCPGYRPMAGLIQGSDGNLYGTCAYWGTYGGGNIFRIIMPGPELRMVTVRGAAVLSWRSNYQGFALQTSPTLAGGTWSVVTNAPISSNGKFWITNALSGDTSFFRLRK